MPTGYGAEAHVEGLILSVQGQRMTFWVIILSSAFGALDDYGVCLVKKLKS